MHQLQVKPNIISYNSILNAAAQMGDLSACQRFGRGSCGRTVVNSMVGPYDHHSLFSWIVGKLPSNIASFPVCGIDFRLNVGLFKLFNDFFCEQHVRPGWGLIREHLNARIWHSILGTWWNEAVLCSVYVLLFYFQGLWSKDHSVPESRKDPNHSHGLWNPKKHGNLFKVCFSFWNGQAQPSCKF